MAKAGDIVFHAEKANEYYSIERPSFDKKYQLVSEADKDNFEKGEWIMTETFKTPDTYVNAIQVEEETAITAPWGEIQGVRKGGYLVSPVKGPESVWCVDQASFEKDYFEVDQNN